MIPVQNYFSSSNLQLTAASGMYVLFIDVSKDITLEIGSLGEIKFVKGFYIYIGSALSPGGLAKRVERHLRSEKKLFWHIDYLLNSSLAEISAVAWIADQQKLECSISQEIDKLVDLVSSISHFGSSDCKCKGHLKLIKGKSIRDFYKIILSVIVPFDFVFEKFSNNLSR